MTKKVINRKRSFSVADKYAASECTDFIEESLSAIGVHSGLVIKTQLIAEEMIANLISNAPSDGSIRVQVKKIFGDAAVNLSAEGSEFDPYGDKIEASGLAADGAALGDAEAESAIRSIVLKALGENFKYIHKKGVNRIRIMTGHSGMSLLKGTAIALVLGLVFGLIMHLLIPAPAADAICTYLMTPVSTMFMNAIKIIIAPVVFFSIVSCISQFSDFSELGRIGAKVMGMYTLTTVFAVIISIALSLLFKPGSWGFAVGHVVQEVEVDMNADTSVLSTIINIIPSNFLRPFLESDTLQIIFLALLVGAAVGRLGEYSSVLIEIFDACNSLFLTVTTMITRFIPVAVFCSVTLMVVELGGDSFTSLLGMTGVYLLSLVCMLVVYGLIILFIGHLNPITFYKKNREGMLTSLTLASSSAAMPTNMRTCTEKLGVSSKVCSFSIPLGATINMDGLCCMLTVAGLFLARAYGVTVPASSLASLILTIVLLSLGAPGVPGAGLVCIGVVLSHLGVPVETMGLIIGIYPFLDMFCTMSNTTGDVMTSVVVAKTEGLLDEDIYRS